MHRALSQNQTRSLLAFWVCPRSCFSGPLSSQTTSLEGHDKATMKSHSVIASLSAVPSLVAVYYVHN